MTTKAHDIDAIEARRDELAGDYVGIFRAFNGTMNDIPARSDLRDLDARREAAARDTRAALEDQERIAQALIENAHAALGWADGVLDSGDFSDGLDGMDRESLARVFDRAVVRGDKARAIAAARLLDADGDTTAIPRLDANYSDVGVALDYLEAYGGDPSAVLAPLRPYGVKLPDDSRIRPSAEVARQIEREEAALHDAKAAKRGADRRELHDRISATLSGGRAIGDEARQRAGPPRPVRLRRLTWPASVTARRKTGGRASDPRPAVPISASRTTRTVATNTPKRRGLAAWRGTTPRH